MEDLDVQLPGPSSDVPFSNSMEAFHATITDISNAMGSLLDNAESPMTMASNPALCLELNMSVHSDEHSDVSQAIPSTLIKEQWQVILGQDATADDLNKAIENCKALVISTEQMSTERQWLVRHLVELRFRLTEIEESMKDPNNTGTQTQVVLGHHFVDRHTTKRVMSKVKQFCDHCTGVIWSVVQASYICADCGYCVHHKCINSIARVCAHISASENKEPTYQICPEMGLAKQKYQCFECETWLSFKPGQVEPRLCDYNGKYYCHTCHWNDFVVIPSRIVHNWEFTRHKVCRASMQVLNILHERPVIDIEQRNPKLFIYVQNLSLVKKLRTNLNDMRRYLCECRIAIASKILEAGIGGRRHLIQNANMYSIADLIEVENGAIVEFLNRLFAIYEQHIRKCELCSGKGYVCEICRNVEILFPFDDGAISCKTCLTVFHRPCWLRKNQKCPKCARFELRKSQMIEGDDKGPSVATSES